jgi:hypothetical protein
MHKHSKTNGRCTNCESSCQQSAADLLQPINSTNIIDHLRNQQILTIFVIHLLEDIDKVLRGRR